MMQFEYYTWFVYLFYHCTLFIAMCQDEPLVMEKSAVYFSGIQPGNASWSMTAVLNDSIFYCRAEHDLNAVQLLRVLLLTTTHYSLLFSLLFKNAHFSHNVLFASLIYIRPDKLDSLCLSSPPTCNSGIFHSSLFDHVIMFIAFLHMAKKPIFLDLQPKSEPTT